MAASASCVASTPATMTLPMSTPAAFSAWMAPIAISSLFDTTASNCTPELIQLVIRSVPWVRVPVAGLLLDDLDAGALGLGDHVVDVLGALARGLVGQLAHQHQDVALAAHDLADFLHLQRAGIDFSFEPTNETLAGSGLSDGMRLT